MTVWTFDVCLTRKTYNPRLFGVYIVNLMFVKGVRQHKLHNTKRTRTRQGVRTISVIPYTPKREHDNRFHLLQDTTVQNIIDFKTRRVTRFLNRFFRRVINSLLLTVKRD